MTHEEKFTELHGALAAGEKAFMVEVPEGVNPFSPLSKAIPQGGKAAYANGTLYVKTKEFTNPDATELQV